MKQLEIDLLTATLTRLRQNPEETHDKPTCKLLDKILEGEFVAALLLPEAQRSLRVRQQPGGGTVPESNGIEQHSLHDPSLEDRQLELQTAVACLLLFLQANLTGPPLRCSASPAKLATEPVYANDSEVRSAQAPLGHDSTTSEDRWALQELAVDGEEVVGRVHLPQYLLLARNLLLTPLGLSLAPGDGNQTLTRDKLPKLVSELPSWGWWTARLLAVNQRLLARSSASLRSALQVLMPQVVKDFGPKSQLELGQHQKSLAAAACIESAMIEHLYHSPQTALGHLKAAEAALGMSVQLEGAMGVRTAHQVDPKAQLVVHTSAAAASDSSSSDQGEEVEVLDAMRMGNQAEPHELKGLTSDSDVLSAPRLVGGPEGGSLGGLQQAVLLGWAQQVKKGTSVDELQGWQMAPYAEAILRQARSWPLLRAGAELMKARHERSRTRTLERSLVQMQALAEALHQPLPPVLTRLRHAFGVLFPLRPSLRRELGEQLLGTGLVGAAMSLFEEEELWDSLIICYRLLQKLPQAQQLVQARLQVTPGDASLLCALGDITLDDSHYERAWEASGARSARAQRSLARSAQRQQNWGQAARHWEKALALNPLFPQGWFGLGYCCLKTLNHQRALQAFTRCAQQEPDNGEVWNNIAAIHLQLQHAPEAFSALSEAVKLKRDNWQTWSNYAQAALQSNNDLPAVRAVQKVAELTQGERLEVEILTVLLQRMQQARQQDSADGKDCPGSQHQQRQLEQALGTAVKQASSSSKCTPAVWGLCAQYHRSMGFPVSAREALLRQVRGLQATSWRDDAAAFHDYANASIQLGQTTLQLAADGQGQAQNLASTRMQLKSTVKQAADTHSDDALYQDLQKVLQQVEDHEVQARQK